MGTPNDMALSISPRGWDECVDSDASSRCEARGPRGTEQTPHSISEFVGINEYEVN